MAVFAQPLTHTWTLTVRIEEIPHFRRLAKAAIRAWGQPRCAEETVLHAVTELLSNVYRHVEDRRCELELRRGEETGSVFVSVTDGCPLAPVVTVPHWTAESGRGLWMLRERAEDFGYVLLPDGKRVWVEVPTHTRNPPYGDQSPTGARGS
ncbi:ATP-binding protein [Streptomyces iconiensis]|uniref:ATP-binding protein n=1 Tax=Streptomyces iconiensis TaxID=1384038 RepID=A0ABT6ZXN9_9ACTN|nr:ATP-binding protein [Streptomyces iconiensis]MDJ1133838.1 ATP-binding protein [Streptomyces iconiensis]